MKKRNKKYNPLKVIPFENEKTLKHMAVSFFATDKDSNQTPMLIDLKGNTIGITKKLANAIQMHPYKWSVMLCVFCIEKGEARIKMELAAYNKRDYQRNLLVELNDLHQAYVAKLQKLNVKLTGVGWVASPVCRDFSEDEVGNIFTKLNAF